MAFGRAVFGKTENRKSPDVQVVSSSATKVDQTDKSDDLFYELKEELRRSLIEIVDAQHLQEIDVQQARQEIARLAREILARRSEPVPGALVNRIVDSLVDDVVGFGPLEPLLARDDITDIMVNGPRNVFIEVGGKVVRSEIRFKDNEHLLNVCQRIVSMVGRRVDESSPICDARLLDGSRVNVIAPPLALDGAVLTIRKFKKDKLTLADLVKFNSITPSGAELLRIISKSRCNLIVSGGTGSGKTTLLNCLTGFIEHSERIVTCEDAAELQLQQQHVVRLETRPANLEGEGEIVMRDLVKNCLRMRPDRIVVGEVRGGEAFDLLQAMNTGHDGSMGTVHANSPREALRRIETMVVGAGFNLPAANIREMIAGSIDVVVQTARLRDGRRVISAITEVVGMEEDTIVTQDLLRFEIDGEDQNGSIIGRHAGTGIGVPKFSSRASYFNETDALATALADINSVAADQSKSS
ncbi:CpaF family protein [Marivivens sp. JLT3646]|uniref:CpaF family protein n=1 Tax=Marivivens sp. JLT3646 TaxID=1920883 RepID=UPI0007FDF2EA|nr:CpaF family protein [Marivivens sp. JLT3646]APO87208.1 protein kinase [Marivivens sp. JLT3646]OBR39930.1 protein kinase [Donghicola sp. JL3646]